MIKKLKVLLLAGALALGMGCAKNESTSTEKENYKISLILDEGGVNDQSFNQASWEGALASKEKYGVEVNYIESESEGDYVPNIETAIDNDADLIIGVGYKLTEAIEEASSLYPNQKFAIVDGAFETVPSNVVNMSFNEEQAGYTVGLIASQMTEGKVAFIGGYDIPSVSNFYKGYEKAIKEVNPNIEVLCQYANSFTDAAKGKAMAQQLIKDGYDIIFTAGGGVNNGVWEACVENNKKAIGVDIASSKFSSSVITSALKNVGTGVDLTIKDLVEGAFKGGEVKMFDLTNNGVGYELTDHLNPNVIDFVEGKINSK